MEVGSPDEGPVSGFVKFGDRLLIVKASAVYEIKMADTIDPERTNAAIPNSQQRVLSIGSDSSLLGCTVLTADTLFRPEYLPDWFNRDAAMATTLLAARELIAMSDEYVRLKGEVEHILANIGGAPLKQGFSIPAIVDLEPRYKTFLQRAHHFVKAAMDIARLFFGAKITHPDSLLTFAVQEYGEEDPFRRFLEEAVPTLRLIWHMRNAVEHAKADERVVLTNFALKSDGTLELPTVELIHPKTAQPSVFAVDSLSQIVEVIPIIFEILVAYLCERHLVSGHFQVSLVELPAERRHQTNVRFSYAMKIGGQWAPVG